MTPLTRSCRTKWDISSLIKRGNWPLSNLPHKGFKAFWGSFEGVMSNPLNWIGDPSQRRLGVTLYWKGGYAPFPTFPQIHKVVFGWSWRRAMPSSIKRGDPSQRRLGVTYWEGEKDPFPTNPKTAKIFFGWNCKPPLHHLDYAPIFCIIEFGIKIPSL